jgi:deferrochelatase/peroxidase EfeB
VSFSIVDAPLEAENIQSDVVGGYGHHAGAPPPQSCAYVLLRFVPSPKKPKKETREWTRERRKKAQQFLQELEVTWANGWKSLRTNVGFTYSGVQQLLELEGKNDVLRSIGKPFDDLEATMAARSESLGDGAGAASDWEFSDGATKSDSFDKIDAIVMIFGSHRTDAARKMGDALEKRAVELGLGARCLLATGLDGDREHFGFVDGISQPLLEGVTDRSETVGNGVVDGGDAWRRLKPGEIVLGYEDEHGGFDGSPFLRNGSFFVLRKLEQDVKAFHEWLDDRATELQRSKTELASWLMGRSFDGEPLVASQVGQNGFRYAHDPDGLVCPLGAHIRRTNPRDVSARLADRAERHRMLRRSLMYAEKLDGSYHPLETSRGARLLAASAKAIEPRTATEAEAAEAPKDTAAKTPKRTEAEPEGEAPDTRSLNTKPSEEPDQLKYGMLFGCYCADIGRQFEVVQGGWINGGESAPRKLFTRDPVAGTNPSGKGDFIVPGGRDTLVLKNVGSFTTPRAGAYFFVPGRQAYHLIVGKPLDGDQPGPQPLDDASTRFWQQLQARRSPPNSSDVGTKLMFGQVLGAPLRSAPRSGAPPAPPLAVGHLTNYARYDLDHEQLETEQQTMVLLAKLRDVEGARRMLTTERAKLDGALAEVLYQFELEGKKRSIHHARFLITSQFQRFAEPASESKAKGEQPKAAQLEAEQLGGPHLLFICRYDGTRRALVRALAERGQQLPFFYCEGCPDDPRKSVLLFRWFMFRREVPVSFAYQAYSAPVYRIERALGLRERFVTLVADLRLPWKTPGVEIDSFFDSELFPRDASYSEARAPEKRSK